MIPNHFERRLNRRPISSLLCVAASLLFVFSGCTSASRETSGAAADPSTTRPAVASAAPTSQPIDFINDDPSTAHASPYEIDQLKRDLGYLASDDLEGRGVGTRGLSVAADYIANRFSSLGLRPVPGCSGYFQNFDMKASVSVDPKTSLSVNDKKLETGKEFAPVGFSAESGFSGQAVFVGYGVADNKDFKYDDYAGMDVKGKVVIVLRYEPHNEKGTSRFVDGDWSANAALNAKAEAAAAHGAAAVLLVNPPKFHGGDRLVPIERGGAKSDIPFLSVKRTFVDDLLKQAGIDKTLEQLQTDIDTSGKPQSFALNGITIAGNVKLKRELMPVKNVLAYLPGSTHPDEFVIVGAHYDHLGRGLPGSLAHGSHDIHHGADDNASGTTAVLDLADRIVRAGRRDRSVLFILFTGEEEGLIGSQYFCEHPPIKLDHVVAMLNLDMVGRIRNEMLYVGGGGTAPVFDGVLSWADQRSPLQIKSIGKGGWGPSDHQSFAMKKIPVLFFFSGMHSDYHTPTDTADKINYQGIAEVAEMSQRVIDAMTEMPHQQYVAAYDSQRLNLGGSGGGPRGGTRVTLGIVPDYGTDESTVGVRITGTSAGSPAAAAGLKEGDIIFQMNDKKIANLYDLTDFLARGKPGDQVTIKVKRDKEETELHATLAARRDG